MKKILFTILIIGGVVGLYYYYFFSNNCRLPIAYTVGEVDSRFNISQEEIVKTAQEATQRWNEQSGFSLFSYQQEAALKINLVYDYRQEAVDQIKTKINDLSGSKIKIEDYWQNYDSLLNQYQQDLLLYNQKVSYWNLQGGAPSGIYQSLEAEKNNLNLRRQDLINLANQLNLQTQNYNENLTELKSQIEQRKNLIITQGIYDSTGNSINIYTFGNTDELRLVLMHELGHALGIEHAQNPQAIMYHLLDQQDLKNPQLTQEDINLLGQKCNLGGDYFQLPNRFKIYLTQ